jgi:hypothetical protein
MNALSTRADFFASHVDIIAAKQQMRKCHSNTNTKNDELQTATAPKVHDTKRKETPSPVGPICIVVGRHGVERAASVREPS